jgi:hypothetical protein
MNNGRRLSCGLDNLWCAEHRCYSIVGCGRKLKGSGHGFPDNPDIQRELARGAVNAIIYYGSAQRRDDMAAAMIFAQKPA